MDHWMKSDVGGKLEVVGIGSDSSNDWVWSNVFGTQGSVRSGSEGRQLQVLSSQKHKISNLEGGILTMLVGIFGLLSLSFGNVLLNNGGTGV